MKSQSSRISKPRPPPRLQAGTRRRSSRVRSNPDILGLYFDSKNAPGSTSSDPQLSRAARAVLGSCPTTTSSVEAPVLGPVGAQFQNHLHPSQKFKNLEQPKSRPPKRPHATFLEEAADHHACSPVSKRYRLESTVTRWIESVSGSESYREINCRSDSYLGRSNGEIISRRLTRSAPNMGHTRDSQGFAIPPTPDSWNPPSVAPSGSVSASASSSRKKTLVEDPLYRRSYLGDNNIYLRSSREQVPEHIASLVDDMRKARNSPGPSQDEVWQDTSLENLEMGTAEVDVEDYFKGSIFAMPRPSDSLKRIGKIPMARQGVPNTLTSMKISNPVPDMLYGYNSIGAFPQQQAQLRVMGNEMVANSQDLLYPFFVIELKADGPGGSGSLWVATNQCLGGSASCVNIAEQLNHRLRQCKSDEIQPINSAAFSIAMSGTEARLYISWKHNELDYYMRKVKSFLLQDPEHYVEFRKHVRNIIDWGKDKRLREIQESLDILLEEDRKIASQLARSRPPPSHDSSPLVEGSDQPNPHTRKKSRQSK